MSATLRIVFLAAFAGLYTLYLPPVPSARSRVPAVYAHPVSPRFGALSALLRALQGDEGALASPAAGDARDELNHVASLPAPGGALRTWAPAVAALAGGGAAHAAVARALVQDVYERLGMRPDWAAIARVAPLSPPTRVKEFSVDYPFAIAVPSPNYWPGRRTRARVVHYVVIHDTESGCAAALNTFINPRSDASAHFLVCRDGRVYQLVRVADAAWHAGNAYINDHSIGIEHEGYVGGTYTLAQYEATAAILRWVDAHDNLHLQWTRNAVFGHENVPGADHTDPGPGWDWPLFMSLLREGAAYSGGDKRLAVVLWPRAYVHTCAATRCALLGTANWGEQFVVRARRPGWVGVDFAGAAGWIAAGATGSGSGTVVRVKAVRAVVRAAPATWGRSLGPVTRGEFYASTLVDAAADRRGWWLIEYTHHYAYLCACDTIPGYRPTATPARLTPTPTVTTTPLAYAPMITASATPAATATATPSPTPRATATKTPRTTMTPSPTPRPTATATATTTPTASPTLSATATTPPTPTATATVTPTATITPSPTANATPIGQ